MAVTLVGSRWVSGNLVFYNKSSGATVFTISTTGVSGTITDAESFADSTALAFGTGDDVTIEWTGSILQISPATDDTGSFNIGDGSADIDVKIFLGATGYALFDVGNAQFKLSGVDMTTNAPVVITDSTATSSTSTGALIVTGGIATAADITCGDDLFMSSGGVINFNAGNLTLTHSSGTLTNSGILVNTGAITASAGLTATTGGVTVTAGGLLVTAGRIREVLTPADVDTQDNTLTVAQIVGGMVVHTSTTGGGTVTTDTAVNIIAGAGGVGALTADGQTIICYYINDGDQTLTLAGGNDVTFADVGQTIAASESALVLFRRVTSSTVAAYIVGA
jgi:hypothetical protein